MRKFTYKEINKLTITRFTTTYLTFHNVNYALKTTRPLVKKKSGSSATPTFHAATYYLKPQFHFDKDFLVDKEVKTNLYACIKLIYKADYLKANYKLENFHLKIIFGFKVAQLRYKTLSPNKFGAQIGDEVVKLKAFAVKVLRLTYSAFECEYNWSTFNQIYIKRRNQLVARCINKLVYIIINKNLKDRYLKL
ncbi:hypothetical protein M5K25_016136 [Dendrobium thyrsiflorum]|uniref:Uncharacterized protein n=1 Tax=Dendrobium thyrsiflorum TaxID=117978 RepID=A0ABD0UT33_DENTH